MKQDEADREFHVDRRMINQFLITYLNKSTDYNTQKNMLQAISKILQFTDEEKKTLGLVEPDAEAAQKRGFS